MSIARKFPLFVFVTIFVCLTMTVGLASTPEIVPPKEEETYFSFTKGVAENDVPQSLSDISVESETEIMAEEKPWTYPISQDILEDPMDVLVLTNKDTLLSSDYPPQDDLHMLIEATVAKTKSSEMKVREITNDALVKMFAAADAEGLNLRLHSAYRSYRTQAIMHENRVKSIGKDDGVVQKPGASDHQTGLGVDVINPAWAKEERLNSKFFDTAEGQWMAGHCAEYGFVIRYPEGKTDITGIIYEPWHLRYVGVEVALYMTEKGLTLEEFTNEWRLAVQEYEMGLSTEPVVSSFNF